MGVDAALPPGLWERIRQMIRDELGKLLRSGILRNASISEGGLTIKGGFLRLMDKIAGTETFYVGPMLPNRADGTPQYGWAVRRADGTGILDLYDANPTDSGGALNQALNWRDRGGNVVFADDTNSGQGLARPYLPLIFYPAVLGGVPSTTSGSFTALWRATAYHQQPKMIVAAGAVMDTAGATGEMRVTVNGVQVGATQAVSDAASTLTIGPVTVDGGHMSVSTVEIQARRTSASGVLYAAPQYAYGQQS